MTGQMPDTWFDRAGNHHSWEMVVEERWTPMGPNHVQYEATMTDPNTFTQPWKISFPLYRHVAENYQLLNLSVLSSLKNISTANGVKKGRQSVILRNNDTPKTRATTRVFIACCGGI